MALRFVISKEKSRNSTEVVQKYKYGGKNLLESQKVSTF